MQKILILLSLTITACGPSSKTSGLYDQFSGKIFQYFDTHDRQQIINDLRDMTLDNYALLGIKAARGIVTDPQKLFNDVATAEERTTDAPDMDPLAQATINLQFLGRIQQTIAAFHDTHFESKPVLSLPAIQNGLILARVGDDVYVVGVRTGIMAYNAQSAADPKAYAKLSNGMRVISIDGVPVDEAAKALMPYQSASTKAAADAWAVGALAQRRLAYGLPKKAYADWEFEDEDKTTLTLRLPYYYGPTKRLDALYYLKAKGFKPITDLRLNYDEREERWRPNRALVTNGYSPYDAPQGLIDSQTWYSTDEDSIGYETYRTGYILRDGKAYGVIQLFEFSSDEVTPESANPIITRKKFQDPLRAFMIKLRDAKAPLIIDLRQNLGGNPRNGISLISAIAKPNEAYASTTRAYRVTYAIRQMLEAGELDQLPDLNSFDYDETAREELRKAVAARRDYTSAFTLTDDIVADPKIGYKQKIVALISPNCVSACDGVAILLKTSKRATLIGTSTNGTGAGFVGDGPFANKKWEDRRRLVSIDIPNRLFGLPGTPGEHVMADPDAYLKLNVENRPTMADVAYNETLSDYLDAGRNWYEKAIEVLDTK